MAVYVTGDTHGDWMNRLKTDSFSEQKEMTKDDYVIICGDFGRQCQRTGILLFLTGHGMAGLW